MEFFSHYDADKTRFVEKGLVVFAALVLYFWAPPSAFADVSLPKIFGNNMVLQSSQKIPVWGTASPGEKVTIQLNKQTVSTVASRDGKFSVRLEPESSGGPYSLKLKGRNSLEFTNVMIGEVWLCCGQSNLAMEVKFTAESDDLIANIGRNVRIYQAQGSGSDLPKTSYTNSWDTASSKNVLDFSAVALGTGSSLAKKLAVPIGVICCSRSGTSIDEWSPTEVAGSPGQNQSSKHKRIFDELVSPLIPFAIKGMVWYQGEADVGMGTTYGKKFFNLIEGYRDLWSQEEDDFPFFFVQIPGCGLYTQTVGRSALPIFWDAQRTATDVRNVYLVPAFDLGDKNDLHPSSKSKLINRLSNALLQYAYHQPLNCEIPVPEKLSLNENKISLKFKASHGHFSIKGDGGFSVAASGGKFARAQVEVLPDGCTLQVWNDGIERPTRLSYARSNFPTGIILNGHGLPVSPFYHAFVGESNYR